MRNSSGLKKFSLDILVISLIVLFIGLGYVLGDSLNQPSSIAEVQLQAAVITNQQSNLSVRRFNLLSLTEQDDMFLRELRTLQARRIALERERLRLESLLQYQKIGRKAVSSDKTEQVLGSILLDSETLGILILIFPRELRVADTGVVALSLIPSDVFVGDLVRSTEAVNSQEPVSPLKLTDEIQIYPIMQAELSGAGFEIVSTEKEQLVSFVDSTEWIWTIKPKEVGKHFLVIDISVPGLVNGRQESMDIDVELFPLKIEIREPLSEQFRNILPYILPATIGLLGVLITILANSKKRKASVRSKRVHTTVKRQKKS